MATRSYIGKELETGEIRLVYCHWNGYPSNNGKILLEHYTKEEKIDKLLDLGDLSSLDVSIEKPSGHSFSNKVNGYSIFYGRDREEKDIDARLVKNIVEELKENWCAYAYIFKPKEKAWYFLRTGEEKMRKLTKEEVEKD